LFVLVVLLYYCIECARIEYALNTMMLFHVISSLMYNMPAYWLYSCSYDIFYWKSLSTLQAR